MRLFSGLFFCCSMMLSSFMFTATTRIYFYDSSYSVFSIKIAESSQQNSRENLQNIADSMKLNFILKKEQKTSMNSIVFFVKVAKPIFLLINELTPINNQIFLNEQCAIIDIISQSNNIKPIILRTIQLDAIPTIMQNFHNFTIKEIISIDNRRWRIIFRGAARNHETRGLGVCHLDGLPGLAPRHCVAVLGEDEAGLLGGHRDG